VLKYPLLNGTHAYKRERNYLKFSLMMLRLIRAILSVTRRGLQVCLRGLCCHIETSLQTLNAWEN
jgi:hypothetical protein